MRNYRFPLAICLLASAIGVHAIPQDPAKISASPYVAASHYTAVLHQTTQRWKLTPLDGSEFDVVSVGSNCPIATGIPKGIWLVTQGADNRPELLAPSTTDLPAGHPGFVRLVACGESVEGGPVLNLPQSLIDQLVANSGAVLIDD